MGTGTTDTEKIRLPHPDPDRDEIPEHVDRFHAGDVFPERDGLAESHDAFHEAEVDGRAYAHGGTLADEARDAFVIREQTEAREADAREAARVRALFDRARIVARMLAGHAPDDMPDAARDLEITLDDDGHARFTVDGLRFRLDNSGSAAPFYLLHDCDRCDDDVETYVGRASIVRDEALVVIGKALDYGRHDLTAEGGSGGWCPRDLDEDGNVRLRIDDDPHTRERKERALFDRRGPARPDPPTPLERLGRAILDYVGSADV